MTAIRLWPGEAFGGVPSVDNFIHRGQFNDPNGRWIYNGNKFKNLTECREHVARVKKINMAIPSSTVLYEPHKQSRVPTIKPVKATLPGVATVGEHKAIKPQIEVNSTPKGFRMTIPTPAADVNVNFKTMDEVLELVNKMFKDKE